MADNERTRINRQDINSLHSRLNDLHAKVDAVMASLNVLLGAPIKTFAPARTLDGTIHLPGSQPMGTQTAEVFHPDDPTDPIPGAGPSTARQALQRAADGPTAAVIQIDQNSRNNYPTHRKDQP